MIAADLDDGLSCVWLVPDNLVNGVAEDLLAELSATSDGLRVPVPEFDEVPQSSVPPPTRPGRSAGVAPEWATDRFGLLGSFPAAPRPMVTKVTVTRARRTVAERMLSLVDRAPEVQGDPLALVVAAEWLRGKVIVLRAWDERDADDVGSAVIRFAALVKEAGMLPADRPRLLVAARTGDLPGSALERMDSMMARVHWWWGGTGRLDTEVVVATARPLRRRATVTGHSSIVDDMVFNAVIVEVAGPDLALADHLASMWDGRMTTLSNRVKDFVEAARRSSVMVPDRWGGGRDRPPQELRQAWALGLVDRWEGEVRISPVASELTQADLDTLIWRGQSRALTVIVDRGREYLERRFRQRASVSLLAELVSDDDWRRCGNSGLGTLELNRMAWAVDTRRVRLDSRDRTLLYRLRDARNALAHRSPLSDEELAQLARVLPDEADG